MLNSIQIDNLSFSYPQSLCTIFECLSLTIGQGWTAIVGPNGCGKSTLLKLISGELKPDTGFVRKDDDVYILRQDMEKVSFDFDYDYSLIGRLNLPYDFEYRYDSLSGGEKKKCMILAALSNNPSILLLDEIANHIDEESATVIKKELKRYRGIGIVVSHNLSFLSRLCSNTIIVGRNGEVTVWNTDPVTALKEAEEKKNFLIDEYKNQKRKIESLTSSLKSLKNANEARAYSLSKRGMSSKDHDGKGKVDAARLTGKDSIGRKSEKVIESRLNKMDSELNQSPGLRKSGAGFEGSRFDKKILLSKSTNITSIADGALSLHHPDLIIKNDSKIVITGANGSGKTSLINYLLGELDSLKEKLWYLKQELSVEERSLIVQEVNALNDKDRGSVLSIVYRLGSEPNSVLSTTIPSPGEARKLCYALALLKGASLIILDEPTNHMDIESIMCYRSSLSEFKGALIVVTHDREFASQFATEYWHLERDFDNVNLSKFASNEE